MTPLERDLAIRTIYGEAGQEPEEGMAAVAHVIRNRVGAGTYGRDVRGVILAPNQFEPWGRADARARMQALSPDSPEYQRIGTIVDAAWGGGRDPTGGATHFYSPTAQRALGRADPSWATPDTHRGDIGRHSFYSPRGGRARSAAPTGLPDGFELVPDGDAPMPLVAQPTGTAPGAPTQQATAIPDLRPRPERPAEGLPPGFELVPDAPATPEQPPIDRSRFGDTMVAEGGITPEQVAAAARRDQGIQTAVMRRDVRQEGDRRAVAARAALRGAGSGFLDEAAAAIASTVGRGSTAPTWGERYGENLTHMRALEAADAAEAPGTNLAGGIAGAVTGGIAAPIGAGARTLRAIAGVGAGLGALSGFGAGEGGLVNRAASSAVGGAVGGALAPAAAAATTGVTRAAGALLSPVAPYIAAARGLIAPTAEAERRAAGAIARDARAAGQTPAQMADEVLAPAAATGQPVVALDVGRETTRALARSSANTSPEARAALNQSLDARYENQSDRAIDFIRRMAPGVDNPTRLAEIEERARRANNPNYRELYRAAPDGLWDEAFETLAGAPAMQTAMRQAMVTMRNEAGQQGGGRAAARVAGEPARPAPPGAVVVPGMVQDAQGRLMMGQGGATPGIQFWDQVQRNLRAMGGREAESLRRTLNDHLDNVVPQFRDTRAVARGFFGETEAVEAGRAFVGAPRSMENSAARQALAGMSNEERDLFAQGFASEVIRRLENTSNRRDVLNTLFLDPRNRGAMERVEIALGPQRTRELEAWLRVEGIMSGSRAGVQGNSTTVRQLVEAGLAGGAAGAYTEDWRQGGAVAAGHFAARRYAIPAIDQRVAQRVGEILASGNEQQIQRLIQRAGNNGSVLNAIRMIEAAAVGEQAGARAPEITGR